MYFAGLNYFVLGYSLTEYRFKRTKHIIISIYFYEILMTIRIMI